jgi:hypothetical protein
MEKKFTPGPWVVRGQRVWNEELKCGDIAHLYCKSTTENKDFKTDEMGNANARAIAAVPDLIEALEYVINYHREHDSGEGELFGLDFVTTCIAALQKATGDSFKIERGE